MCAVVGDGASTSKPGCGPQAGAQPAQTVVPAACAPPVPPEAAVGEGTFLDFTHLKEQLSMTRLLDHLGLSARLRGNGGQWRGACPLHRGDGRGRTFSVNLDDNVFHCFDSRCGKEGDVIGLWAALHQLDLRTAALDLVQTFGLEPAPPSEQRRGTVKVRLRPLKASNRSGSGSAAPARPDTVKKR